MPQSSSPDKYGKKSPFRPAKQQPLLTRVIPVAGELPRYRVPSARRDMMAGVTVAALAVPAAMAYAELAGLSPVNGLYALLLLPSVAYVLLGSSRQLINGPEGSVSTLIAAAILPLAAPASGDRGRERRGPLYAAAVRVTCSEATSAGRTSSKRYPRSFPQ